MLQPRPNPVGVWLAACLAVAGCGSPDATPQASFEGRLSTSAEVVSDEPPQSGQAARRGIGGLSSSEPSPRIALSSPGEDPQRQHLLGVAQLKAGDPRGAVRYLRAALRDAADPAPALRSDLAVALIADYERHDEAIALVEALDLLERAVEQAPGLAEARFNRALALEKLHLRRPAREAWQAYLKFDGDDRWARTARSRLAALAEPEAEPPVDKLHRIAAAGDPDALRAAIGEHRQEARRLFETDWLAAWAADPSPERLELLETVAAALHHHTGDPFAADVVDVLRDASKRDALVRGHAAYAEGYAHYRATRLKRARPSLERALAELTSGGSPFHLWALHLLAIVDQYEGEFAAATQRLAAAAAVAAERGYLALGAQTRWILGLVHVNEFRIGHALASYREALVAFEALGERGNVAFLRHLTAGSLDQLGDARAAWNARRGALAERHLIQHPRQRDAILIAAAIFARQAHPAAAIRFLDAVGEDPLSAADARIRRARAWLDLGHAARALRDVRLVRDELVQIEDQSFRARAEGELAVVEGLAHADRDPRVARQHLDRAIEASRRLTRLRLPELLLARGRLALRGGDLVRAEADFVAGIEAYERTRGDVEDRVRQISFFDAAGALFDRMVALKIRAGDADAALRWAERARSRQLLDRLAIETSADPGSLVRAIGPDTALVYYALLDERLLAWTITADGVEHDAWPIDARTLGKRIVELHTALANRDPGIQVLGPAGELYRELIARLPVEARRRRKLVFAPHKILHAVPFAALWDGERERHLIQDHEVVVVPGATPLARALAPLPGSQAALLAVGDPSFDRRANPRLPRLPAAVEEARGVAGSYANASLLLGDDATKTRFLQALARHRIVHFAGHAIANELDPDRSRLLLAADAGSADDGTLLAGELYDASMAGLELVVLAACETASGRISVGEGALSLAHPFLAAGVPAVVASLWSVDDTASRELFLRFHAALAAGAAPAKALREAQIALLQAADPRLRAPSAWAAFRVIGGSNESIR